MLVARLDGENMCFYDFHMVPSIDRPKKVLHLGGPSVVAEGLQSEPTLGLPFRCLKVPS